MCIDKNYRQQDILVWALVSIAGFSFWFLVAVPFANHNESYFWLVRLQSLSFTQFLVEHTAHDWRPFANIFTWLTYRLGDNSIIPVQFINYILTAVSWIVLFFAIREKRLFSVISLLAGGVFFAGYLYLFHLHGIVYPAPFLMTAGIFLIYERRIVNPFSPVAITVAILMALWHPFSIALYFGFLCGCYVEQVTRLRAKDHRQAGVALTVVVLAILVILSPLSQMLQPTYVNIGELKSNMDSGPTTADAPATQSAGLLGDLAMRWSGGTTSYEILEVKFLSTLVTAMLGAVTILSIQGRAVMRFTTFGLYTVTVAPFIVLSVPVIFLWIIAALVKLSMLRKWALAGLLAVAALLPYGSPSGGSAYGLFALMCCVAVAAMGAESLERRLAAIRTDVVASGLLIVLVIGLLLRNGAHVPVVSPLAKPLLAEKEKTVQLEGILNWLRTSGYCNYRITYVEDASKHDTNRESQNLFDRKRRPAAGLRYVRAYWHHLDCGMSGKYGDAGRPLVITFGGVRLDSARRLYGIDGAYAGSAAVWLRG